MAGRARRRSRGITLTEALVSLCILGLLMGALGRVLANAYASSGAVSGQNSVQQEARHIADELVDTLRSATAFTAGSPTMVEASLSNGATLHYRLTGNELRRELHFGGAQTQQTVSNRLLAMSLTFYLPRGGEWETTDVASVARAMQVSVTVASGADRATETSAVKLRNEP